MHSCPIRPIQCTPSQLLGRSANSPVTIRDSAGDFYSMHSSRFVTVCFLYSGAILLVQFVFIYQFQLNVESLAQLGVALSIVGTGIIRLRNPEEAQTPAEYELFAYSMAVLSIALTVIFLAQLFLV